MHNFKELKVWKEAMELAKELFITTKGFPQDERFGSIAQINRSALSIPSNIAEGAGRQSKKEFNQFLNIALGSSFEFETQLLLSKDFKYLTDKQKRNY